MHKKVMTQKHALMDEYFLLGGNHRSKEAKAIGTRIKSFIRDYGNDEQLESVLMLIKITTDGYTTFKHDTYCLMSKPTLDRLHDLNEWDFYDLRTFGRVIGYCDNHQKAEYLLKKSFDILESTYKNEAVYIVASITISSNALYGFLKMRSSVKDNDEYIQKINESFEYHCERALNLSEKHGFDIAKAAVTIRKGIFHGDEEIIQAGFDLLKSLKEPEILKLMKMERDDYNLKVYNSLSEDHLKSMVALNLKKQRQIRGLTVEGLAKQLGVSVGTMSQLENAKLHIAYHHLYKLSKIFSMNVEDFLKIDNDVDKDKDAELTYRISSIVKDASIEQKTVILGILEVLKKNPNNTIKKKEKN